MSSVGIINDIVRVRNCYSEYSNIDGDIIKSMSDEILGFKEKYNLSDSEVLKIASGEISVIESVELIISK